MQQEQTSNNIAEDVANPVMKNSTEATCQHPSLPPLEVDNDQQKENAVEYHSRDKLENAASSSGCENDGNMLRNPHEQHNQRISQTQEAREQHPNSVTSSQNIALNGGEQHQSQIKSEDLSNDVPPPPPTIPPFYPEQQQQHGQPANSHTYYYQHPHPSHYYSSDQRLNYNHQPPPPLHVPSRNGHSFHEHPPPPYPGHPPPYNYSQSAPHYPPPPPSQAHYPQVQHPPYQQHHRPYQYPPHHHSSYHPPTSNNNHGFNYDRPTYHFSLPSDTQSLSDRQCYIRSNLIELFIATEHDVATRPARGQQKIHVGQVGIRCVYCAVNTVDRMDGRKPFEPDPPSAERAACYPQSVNRIYQTVADMQRRHFDKCRRIPVQVMGTYKSLKTTRPRGKIKPQEYWASSAEKIGLVDSEGMGIRVREDGEGKMVNQFLMQRKSVEGGVYGEDVVHCSNDNDLTAAVQDGGEGDGMPPPKRVKSMNGGNDNISGGKCQSSSEKNNGGQKTSYSDAHLLASMRDGASPSEMKSSENGEVAAPQLKEEEEDKRKEMKLVSTPI